METLALTLKSALKVRTPVWKFRGVCATATVVRRTALWWRSGFQGS